MCSHILAILDVAGVVSIRKMMANLLVQRGSGRPRIATPVLRQQFISTGMVSVRRDRPDLYLMQNIRRDTVGKFNITCVISVPSKSIISIIYILRIRVRYDHRTSHQA